MTPEERILARHYSTNSVGKYCVVLDRLQDDSYLIAYLTTFGGKQNAFFIHPSFRWSLIAFGGDAPWPLDFQPVRTLPRPWPVKSFLLALPVTRSNLRDAIYPESAAQPWFRHIRFRVSESELRRVEDAIRQRSQVR
jgi:hypothetical protein